jgi:hypothetical protein
VIVKIPTLNRFAESTDKLTKTLAKLFVKELKSIHHLEDLVNVTVLMISDLFAVTIKLHTKTFALLDVQTPECFICNHAKTILKLEEEVQ